MFKRINFQDEFYQKLRVLVLPITVQHFMLALVSATDAVMLGAVDQTSLSAVSLAGQIQFAQPVHQRNCGGVRNYGGAVLGKEGCGFH